MIKIRVTYVDNEKGNKELDEALSILEDKFNIINKSKIYKGRGTSQYNNIYLDVELEEK